MISRPEMVESPREPSMFPVDRISTDQLDRRSFFVVSGQTRVDFADADGGDHRLVKKVVGGYLTN